jgi:hypothetical protein
MLGWRKENLEGFHILQCPSIPADLIKQMEDYFRRVVHGETMLEILETVRMDIEGKSHFMKYRLPLFMTRKGRFAIGPFICEILQHK